MNSFPTLKSIKNKYNLLEYPELNGLLKSKQGKKKNTTSFAGEYYSHEGNNLNHEN